MLRKHFNNIWMKVAKQRDWIPPQRDDLDFYWACMGVLGRYSCPEKFEEKLTEDGSIFAEWLIFEVKAHMN